MELDELATAAARVDSKASFLKFVVVLRADWEAARAEAEANPSPPFGPRARDWENMDLGSFLGAMAAWLQDADGYYRNTGQVVDTSQPSWKLFADSLMGAVVYE